MDILVKHQRIVGFILLLKIRQKYDITNIDIEFKCSFFFNDIKDY